LGGDEVTLRQPRASGAFPSSAGWHDANNGSEAALQLVSF